MDESGGLGFIPASEWDDHVLTLDLSREGVGREADRLVDGWMDGQAWRITGI